MFILVTFFRGVPNFGFNPFRRGRGRPIVNGQRRFPSRNLLFGNLGARRISPFGGARQVYGPGVFARSPFTRRPVGYFPFTNFNRNSPLQRRFGIGTTRQLVNNLNFRFGVRPFTSNIGNSLFGFSRNLERNLASRVRARSTGNIMDRINNMVNAYLVSQGIAPTTSSRSSSRSFSSSFSSSAARMNMSFATDSTAFMIIVQPIKLSDLTNIRDSVISSA